ncbi:hypothetical protein HU200_028528 [Digitaria exilis]|uniref:VWFA domain-containing protein n=1 Tax=Digitaria exilis TaxID=1010633 RepID=A0A835BVF1_9POAL|nr:hypothetical protein HU200_028528 [Digitaria exilis]
MPVESPAAKDAEVGNGVLVVTTHCEYLATIPDDEYEAYRHDTFAVMVHVKAPTLFAIDDEAGRTPLDLVAVLDVSASMVAGPTNKLQEAKRAMALVVNSLGPRDRLSVVVFSDDARRVVPPTRMSEHGKATAKLAMESLVAGTGETKTTTNIRAGLDEAAKVVEECRRDNDVAAIILLSDGYDNHSASDRNLDTSTNTTEYNNNLVPPHLVSDGGLRCTPVHTFAFGSDHDEEALHGISSATRGTFTFIDNNNNNLQYALARCVGGLRSVTAQDVWIEARCQYLDSSITAVKSGVYESTVISEEGAEVYVGELYADEERRFLFFLDVPREDEDGGDGDCYVGTRLITARCNYIDMATGQPVSVAPTTEYIKVARSTEVQVERHRVEAADDVALAHVAAERGEYAEAGRILAARREMVSRSTAVVSGDAKCKALAAELDELRRRVMEEGEYRRAGRASLLASMSAHAQQRGSATFATPAMRKVEELWEMRRRRQREAAPTKNGGSNDAHPARSWLDARLAPRLSMLRRYMGRLVPFIKP